VTVRGLARAGSLPFSLVGKRLRFRRSDVTDFINRGGSRNVAR
jgi:excisionase family DNA binding protein